TQTDRRQAVARAQPGVDERLADELRLGRHHGFHHADLLQSVRELGVGERKRFQPESLRELAELRVRRRQVDEEDVAGPELGAYAWPDQVQRVAEIPDVAERPPPALDREHVQAERLAVLE